MDDETRAWLRQLFGDPPPRDVVPGEGLTRADLKWQNDRAGQVVTVTVPGEVIEDVDGVPIGVGPSTSSPAELGGVVISQSDVDRLGLTAKELEEDFPNVTVWSPTPKEHDSDRDDD